MEKFQLYNTWKQCLPALYFQQIKNVITTVAKVINKFQILPMTQKFLTHIGSNSLILRRDLSKVNPYYKNILINYKNSEIYNILGKTVKSKFSAS